MATRMFDRRPAAATADPHERVATIVARHGDLLLRVARHYALCADDAHDAVQRALEIYMRRVDSLDPATELAWLKVVVKHESLAVRRGRAGVASEDVDLDAVPAESQRSVEERFESNERVERSAEVMRRLKRDEARALMLKAEGLSYNEIGERLGWTYTKVVSSLALFIALGGTSYALTLPRNSVGSAADPCRRSACVGGAFRRRQVERGQGSLARRPGSARLLGARIAARTGPGPAGPPGAPGPSGRHLSGGDQLGGRTEIRGNATLASARGRQRVPRRLRSLRR